MQIAIDDVADKTYKHIITLEERQDVAKRRDATVWCTCVVWCCCIVGKKLVTSIAGNVEVIDLMMMTATVLV